MIAQNRLIISNATEAIHKKYVMSRARLHPLTISATRALPDGIAISLSIPADLAKTFEHTPGQYLSVEATIAGEKVRRSYSICSYHKDVDIEIGIKRVDSGLFSNHALTLAKGDQLDVLPPEGRFTTNIDKNNQRHYLLVAAGSGITPCLSIAKSVLHDEPLSRITLLFGNRRISSMMFREDIAALKDSHTQRFNIINILSNERQDVELFNGRITSQLLEQLADSSLLPISEFHSAFLCGPLDMVDSVSETLVSLGLKSDQVHRELFTTGIVPEIVRQPTTANDATAQGHTVTIILDGSQTDIKVDPTQDTVLAAAQRAGIDMPFSCAGGMCCTCRCKVLNGTTRMDANFSLAQWEVDAGYTLACQSRPETDNVVLDFDAT